jgi:DNA repair protein RadA/Sms
MAKPKTTYYCQNCGAQFAKWQGQCSSCKKWNTLVEEVVEKKNEKTWQSKEAKKPRKSRPQLIDDIKFEQDTRLLTKDNELNRVLGGGIVPGCLTLLGGEPGIGKSTLMLQVSLNLKLKTLYVSGEESPQQIKLRADRISEGTSNCYILNQTKTQSIFKQIEHIEPDFVIID